MARLRVRVMVAVVVVVWEEVVGRRVVEEGGGTMEKADAESNTVRVSAMKALNRNMIGAAGLRWRW